MDLLKLIWPFTGAPALPLSPSEAEPEEDDRALEDTTPVRDMPAGKGIFVQSVELATTKGTPAALAARAKDLRLSWIALLVLWQHDDRDRVYNMIAPTIQACAAVNVAVWIWGFPHSGASRIDRFVDYTAEIFESNPVHGVIANAEKPFYGKASAARAFVDATRARLPEAALGLVSYGNPRLHPRFPWSPFAEHFNFGMPEIYDSEHTLGPRYPMQCMQGWRDVGFRRAGAEILVPTWGASKAHTAAQMGEMIERTPRAPACSWWDMNWLRSSTSRANVVRKMNWFDTP